MDSLEELERAAGLDPDSADFRLRQQLAEADDDLIERLVQMRKDKGLTQKIVAKRMNRDVAAVSNFERLRADPHLSTIRRYAAAIGASITHQVVDVDIAINDRTGAESTIGQGSGEINLRDLILSRFTQVDSNGTDELLRSFASTWRSTHPASQSPTAEEMRDLAIAFLTASESAVGPARS